MQHSPVASRCCPAAWRPFRRFCTGLIAALAIPAAAGAFTLQDVAREAQALSRQPYRAPPALTPDAADYDQWRDLRFRADRSLWRGTPSRFEAQFFPAGANFKRPVEILEIVDGQPRPLALTRGDFIRGQEKPTNDATPAAPAGFRLHYPLNNERYRDELIAFLGASYFRALGAGQQYGSSARALALDTVGGPRGEEFPDFVRFWLVRPEAGSRTATVYALLDSPRATGAYQFDVRPGANTQVDVHSQVFLREAVATFGAAPLTSMFYSGENQPVPDDFRPEVHDADGLQIATADGEWLWRPLTRPNEPFITEFKMTGLRGFGLMQRDRDFASYEDLESHYHRRPSIWVEPLNDWGAGRVVLLQLNSGSETEDNAVAFWVPAAPAKPGRPIGLAWRLTWAGDQPPNPPLGRVVQSRRGFGYRAGAMPDNQLQFHIDFTGGTLDKLPPDAQVTAEVSADPSTRILSVRVEPNAARGGWRLTLDIERQNLRLASEMRAVLHHGGKAVTETWAYALAPSPRPEPR